MTRFAFAVTIVAIMLRWAGDIGRTDMLVAAGIAVAAIATNHGRLGLAGLMVGIGLMIHETSLIFGAPLLLAILMRPGAWSALSDRVKATGRGCALALGRGVCRHGTSAARQRHDDVRGGARQVCADEVRRLGGVFRAQRHRGLRTNLCQNWPDPTYWMHPAGGLLLMALTMMALGWNLRREVTLTALATVPPFIFLSIITNDISRWAMFAMFNVWLLHAVAHRREGRRTISEREALLAAVALLVLTSNRIGPQPTPIYSPSPVLERIAVRLFRTRPPRLSRRRWQGATRPGTILCSRPTAHRERRVKGSRTVRADGALASKTRGRTNVVI